MKQSATQEIKREKVFIPEGLTTTKVAEMHGIKLSTAYNAKKKSFFVKNYSRKQIIIDRENFNPATAYNLAGRVFWKNFVHKYKVAKDLKEDLVQEAVTRLFELSGKKNNNGDGKYNDNYTKFWIAHKAMLAFMKT